MYTACNETFVEYKTIRYSTDSPDCTRRDQNLCVYIRRIISSVTPKTMYFHYLKTSFLDRSIHKKTFQGILKTKALINITKTERVRYGDIYLHR